MGERERFGLLEKCSHTTTSDLWIFFQMPREEEVEQRFNKFEITIWYM